MIKIFTEHPNNVQQTYLEHAKFSLCLGISGFKIMMAGFIHAIFPFVLKSAASESTFQCYDKIKKREEDLLRLRF